VTICTSARQRYLRSVDDLARTRPAEPTRRIVALRFAVVVLALVLPLSGHADVADRALPFSAVHAVTALVSSSGGRASVAPLEPVHTLQLALERVKAVAFGYRPTSAALGASLFALLLALRCAVAISAPGRRRPSDRAPPLPRLA
jgi:hypothetical protein